MPSDPSVLPFRLKGADGSFEARIDELIRTLRYGGRNDFLVNICAVLFDSMNNEEIRTSLKKIAANDKAAIAGMLQNALVKLGAKPAPIAEVKQDLPKEKSSAAENKTKKSQSMEDLLC